MKIVIILMVAVKYTYYITPEKLHGDKKFPQRCDFAFICYCPMPDIFKQYQITECKIRYFVHSHPMHVMFCKNNSYNFVVIAEVYGGAMSVTTVEELNYYGVKKIFGIGFVGSFNDNVKIGDNVTAQQSMADIVGTTPYYDDDGYKEYFNSHNFNVYPTSWHKVWDRDNNPELEIKGVGIWTTNAFYRETKEQVDMAKSMGCDCVNMDTSHLYAACNKLNIGVTYYATVSDMLREQEDEDWNNGLNDALTCSSNTSEESIVLINQNKLISYLIKKNSVETIECAYYIESFESWMKKQQVCISHNFSHAYAVMQNARFAIIDEPLTPYQKEAILLAALLHDADDKKFFPNNKNYENMRYILFDKHPDFVNLVAEMIDLVSCSTNGDRMVEEEWKLIPRYADRLEALGSTGIKRCYEYTKTINNPFILPNTVLPTNLNQVWDIASIERYRQYNGKSKSMIDHYYDKLLRLGDFPIKNQWLKQQASEQNNLMAQFVLDFCNFYKSSDNPDFDEFMKSYISPSL